MKKELVCSIKKGILFAIFYGVISFLISRYLVNIIFDNELVKNIVHFNLAHSVLFLVLMGLGYLFKYIALKKLNAEKFFVILAVPLCIIYMLLFVPWNTPDAEAHLAASQRFSNKVLGNEDYFLTDRNKFFYTKVWQKYVRFNPNSNGYLDVYDCLKNDCENVNLKLEMRDYYKKHDISLFPSMYRKMEFYSFVNYVPFIVGIGVGEIFNWQALWGIYLGRILLILFYIFGGYWAIKRMKYKKDFLALFLLNPMLLMMSSAISYDAFLIVGTVNLIVSIFNLNDEYNKKNLIWCMIWCIFVASIKGGGCSLIVLLGGILISKKQDKNMGFASILLVTFISLLFFNVVLPWNKSLFQFGFDDARLSVFYAFTNPVDFFSKLIMSYRINGIFMINSMIGYLGHCISMIENNLVIAFYTLFILMSALDTQKITLKIRVYSAIIFLMYAILMPMMLLCETRASDAYIVYIQGRYYLPVFVFLMLLVPNINKVFNFEKKHVVNFLFILYALLSVYVVYCLTELFLFK